MMNYIWSGMLLMGILYAAVKGTLGEFSDSLMSSCTEGVYFVIGLAGIMAVWTGLMRVAKESGLLDSFARRTAPLFQRLFPDEKDPDTIAAMLMSFTANLFGAGNSATVFSLKTMERLDTENRGGKEASDTMCMFMAVSMSMIQLLPVTILKLRTDAGSADAGSVVVPALVAGLVSMVVSVLWCRWMEKRSKRR